ncbi:MAG: glutamine--tRNA ligase/YqeY domain fusion protein [Gemmatimonadota bacterium]
MNIRDDAPSEGTDFIRQRVRADTDAGVYDGRVVTRFPPEPNGYLHIGHATGICLNFGVAEEFGGRCHLRYDDTNPEKEDEEYARAIQRDIRWLGFDWGEHLYYASDYFERMYDCAVVLIEKGLAYVDSQPLEAIREGRGTVTEAGTESPFRDRSVEENLDLFRRMRAGEFEDGAHVLRGKIDMGHPNMLMRDPVFYRIRHAEHYRQGAEWVIYPLYDYAHCLEDAFEGVTHSICTIEFENNRELYDWVLDNVGFEEPRPHQHEWAGLDLEGAVLSKRAILPLVQAGIVSGWDDPRLSTIAAFRRRGVPPEAIRRLAALVGVSRAGARTEEAKLDFAIRDVLNPVAPRVMAVLDPLKVVLTNYPEGQVEHFDAPYFPPDVGREGSRAVPFGRELFIERSDFAAEPPKGFRRLVPGGEVRLRYAFVIRCDEVVEDDDGKVVELRCRYDSETRSGATPDGRKVKGTIQWVSAEHAVDAEVRLFDRLFVDETTEDEDGNPIDPMDRLNPDSLSVVSAKIEPSVVDDDLETRYQFERTGYFWRDPLDGHGDALVYNRIVGLKSAWSAPTPSAAPRSPRAEKGSRGGGPAPGTKPAVSEERSALRAKDPLLAERFARYRSEWGLSEEIADVLTGSSGAGDFFEAAVGVHDDASAVAAWITTDLRGLLEGRTLADLPFDGASLGRLAALVADGSVSRRAGKDVLAKMAAEGGDPAEWVERLGLATVGADDLGPVVDEVLAASPDEVAAYRGGKTQLLGFFVGAVMKATKGAADPAALRTLLTERLDR